MNCINCPGKNLMVKFIKNGYPIIHCMDCDHLFTDFEPTQQDINQIYSDDYFFKGNVGYDDYTLEKEMLIKRGEYYANKMSNYMNPGKVLDIGAAAGFLLKGFENKKWEGTGIEPNHSMVEYGKHILGVNLIQGTIESFELVDKFDLIIMIQVAAHICDFSNSINKLSTYLNPGGHILIETWNKDSITSKLLGKYWHEFSPPSTLNYFSKKTLTNFMNQQEFVMVDMGNPKKSIHSKHAKSLLTHKLSESNSLKWIVGITRLIPKNIIIPYPFDDLFWALYKKY